MKFTVFSTALLRELNAISRVISTNPIVPILHNFLFDIEGDQLTITASDSQTCITTKLAIKGHEDGRMAVPARMLIETLKNLPEQPLPFVFEEHTYSLTVTFANGHYKLACENANDFPQVWSIEDSTSITLPDLVLKKAIEQTISATSKQEHRPALTGVHIVMEKDKTIFVATDGHQLACYTRTDITAPSFQAFTIPNKPLQLLVQLLPTINEQVRMTTGEKHVHFSLGHMELTTSLINQDYPPYENVIPQNNPNKLLIDTDTLQHALKRAYIYANKSSYQVNMAPAPGTLHITTEDLDFSNQASEKHPCVYEGEEMEIGFNVKMLAELLKTVSSQEVAMHFADPSKAVLFIPQDTDTHEEVLLVIMPLLLNKPANEA